MVIRCSIDEGSSSMMAPLNGRQLWAGPSGCGHDGLSVTSFRWVPPQIVGHASASTGRTWASPQRSTAGLRNRRGATLTAEESHPGGYQVDLATVWNGSSQPEIAPPDAAGRLAPPASPRWRNALSHSTSQTVLRDLDGPADVSEWGRCPHVEHRVDTGRPRCRQSCRYFKRHEI